MDDKIEKSFNGRSNYWGEPETEPLVIALEKG